MQPDAVVPVSDLTPAEWLVERLRGLGLVRHVVPAGYEAYVRVPNEDGSLWLLRDVLRDHTRTPGRCWFAIWEGWPLPDAWQTAPKFHLPHRDFLLFAGALDDLDVIATEFGCAVMEYGGAGSVLHVTGRRATPADHHEAAARCRQRGYNQQPSLWWPEERSWVVGSEVDSDASYVAGSRPLADDLLAVPSLEATEVEPDTPITVDD